MKRIPLFVLLLAMGACTQKQVVIKGKLEEGKGKTIILENIQHDRIQETDSVKLKSKDVFRFAIPVKEPQFFRLRTTNNETITLLAEPGEKIRLDLPSGHFSDNPVINGSPGSLLILELETRLKKTISSLDSLRHLYQEIGDEQPDARRQKDELVSAYENIVKKQRNYSIRFILEHSTSLASYMALYQKIDEETFVLNSRYDLQFMKITRDSLMKYYPRSGYTKALSSDLEAQLGGLRELEVRNMISQMEENPVDIAFPDYKGDTVFLNSFKGNYTLLSFWGSWNSTSIEENKELISFYKKYHPRGFQVYQVALDTNITALRKISEYEGYPWIQVIDPSFPKSFITSLLNIRELPANFLLNPEGEFIERDLYGDDLRRILSQIYD